MVLRRILITVLIITKTQITQSMLLLTANVQDLRNIADKLLPNKMSKDLVKLLIDIANIKPKIADKDKTGIYRQIADKEWEKYKTKYKIYKKYNVEKPNIKIKTKNTTVKTPKADSLIEFDKHDEKHAPKAVKRPGYPQEEVDINWLKVKKDLSVADKVILQTRRKNNTPVPKDTRILKQLKSKYLIDSVTRKRASYEDTDGVKIKEDTDSVKIKEDKDVFNIKEDKDGVKIKEDTDSVKIKEDKDVFKIKEDKDGVKVKKDKDCVNIKPSTPPDKIASSGQIILAKKPVEIPWWEKKPNY